VQRGLQRSRTVCPCVLVLGRNTYAKVAGLLKFRNVNPHVSTPVPFVERARVAVKWPEARGVLTT